MNRQAFLLTALVLLSSCGETRTECIDRCYDEATESLDRCDEHFDWCLANLGPNAGCLDDYDTCGDESLSEQEACNDGCLAGL